MMGTVDWIFAACAVIGGIMLLIRIVLMFIGGEVEGDVDAEVPEDVDFDVDAEGLGEADASFRLLSLHGLTAFFAIFGLIGLGLHMESQFHVAVALAGAFLAGLASLFVVSYLFTIMRKLQSSGTLNLANAAGQEGTVYLTIPPGGTGKVRVAVQGRLKVFDAVSESEKPIKTGEAIRVLRVVSGNILLVERL